MQQDAPDLKVSVHGRLFFLHQRIVKLRGVRRGRLEMPEFPGGAAGFELAARFRYSKGRIPVTPSNVAALRCAAAALDMADLVSHTESFLDGMFYWNWGDILAALKSCENLVDAADDCGLLRRLFDSVLSKISDSPVSSAASSSPDAYPQQSTSSSSSTTTKEWWFDDLASLHPRLVEKLVAESERWGMVLTKFLLHYLKQRAARGGPACGALADAAVQAVARAAPGGFSCRALFRVLRVASGHGLSQDSRATLEGLIGSALDQATLDDVLVSGHDEAVYDVSLMVRLLRVFVSSEDVDLARMKKVGRLTDKYLREISPDQCLRPSKFLAIAESLPDSARDCFDGIYRALDIYLETHPGLSFGERSRLCRCLNYEKLTLETCKELAKNPRIPPRSAMRALAAQKTAVNAGEMAHRQSLQTMKRRVTELEKACRQMKGEMARMNQVDLTDVAGHGHLHGRGLPKLC